ncbi:MAG TPA: hypothetical protein VIL07_08670 [Symbiobacteriaceae bacterium]
MNTVPAERVIDRLLNRIKELEYQNAILQAQVEGLQEQVHKLLTVEEKPSEQKKE